MNHRIIKFKNNWKVIPGSRRSQAAIMRIPPGESEGGPDNKHSGDQWLFVCAGSGTAFVEGKKIPLRKNSLLFIKAGERHEIKNTSRQILNTLNLYSPPQY